jgi:hypothetical protein
MLDGVIFLKNNLADHFVIYFIPLYILGRRPVAILSAQFLGFGIPLLLPVVVMFRYASNSFIRVFNTPPACGGVSASSLSLGRGVG